MNLSGFLLPVRIVHGQDTVFTRCPEGEDRSDSRDPALFILAGENQPIGIGNEMEVAQDAFCLRAFDPSMPQVELVNDHCFVPPEEFPERNEILPLRRPWSAQLQQVLQVIIPQPGKSTVVWLAKEFGSRDRETRLRPDAKPGDHGMEIEYCLYSGLVALISLVKSPLLLEIPPGEDVQDGLLSAIKDDELAFFYFDGRDPMAPLLDAKENRDASLQIGNQFTSGRLRIISAKKRQVAIESPGGLGELELIGSRPPTCPGEFGDPVLVCQDAKHDEAVLQGEGSALPEVRLRVESHRRRIPSSSVGKTYRNFDKRSIMMTLADQA